MSQSLSIDSKAGEGYVSCPSTGAKKARTFFLKKASMARLQYLIEGNLLISKGSKPEKD
jgi:hypothetical protein